MSDDTTATTNPPTEDAQPTTRPEGYSTNEKGEVLVPARVLAGITAVRDGGRTNMFDISTVAILCAVTGYPEAEEWLTAPTNRKAYTRGVFQGFAAEAAEQVEEIPAATETEEAEKPDPNIFAATDDLCVEKVRGAGYVIHNSWTGERVRFEYTDIPYLIAALTKAYIAIVGEPPFTPEEK